MTRVLTALVAVPLLLALIFAAPAWAFLVLALLVSVQGYREMAVLADKGGFPLLAIGYALAPLLAASLYPGAPGFAEVAVASVVLAGSAAVMSRRPGKETLGAIAATLLAIFYVGGLLASIVALRLVSPESEGRAWILFLLAVVMVGDAGAYFAGMSLGRTPMAPGLSPKKTMEGFAGGVLASIATAAGLAAFELPRIPLLQAAALGLVLALLGVLGDLFESLLKRSAGVKDTAALLPGHGGILDRIDSLLFAAPALLMYVTRA